MSTPNYVIELMPTDALIAHAKSLQDERKNMLDALRRASVSLGAFCSDEGWSQSDMDTLDAVDAAIAPHKNHG